MKKQTARPETDWMTMPAPGLQIVTDDIWNAVHARLTAVRGVYLKATGGRPFGRPALGGPSKYLLTNLALCGCCGGPMKVRSRSHGTGRKHFYGCARYHDRGRTVCTNGSDVPMTLEAERQALRAERRLEASDATRMRSELLALADSWRTILADDPTHARPIVSSLLTRRVTITPMEHAKRRWTLKGNGTVAGLFQMAIFPSGWRPQREP